VGGSPAHSNTNEMTPTRLASLGTLPTLAQARKCAAELAGEGSQRRRGEVKKHPLFMQPPNARGAGRIARGPC